MSPRILYSQIAVAIGAARYHCGKEGLTDHDEVAEVYARKVGEVFSRLNIGLTPARMIRAVGIPKREAVLPGAMQ